MDKIKSRYVLKWDNYSKQTSAGLRTLMEKRSLVDVVICCGTQTIHAHKCVLAAHSSYFKEQFEKQSVEQILFHGIDFTVIKSLIEFIYCGEITIVEEYMKCLVAVVKLLKISALEQIFAQSEFKHFTDTEQIIPVPQFICKPPKYPTLYKPYNVPSLSTKSNYNSNNYLLNKLNYKNFDTEAEKACAKEAQASLITLSNLRKVMSNSAQLHSFIVDDNINETTVTRFIPNTTTNDDFVENIETVELDEKLTPNNNSNNTETLNILPVTIANNCNSNENLTTDKIRHMLRSDNVQIMFQTSDGNIINVRNEDDLINLAKGDLTYRTVDESGNVGEIQELKLTINDNDNKENDKSLVNISNNLTTNYNNDSMYDSGFNMQNSTIFEPENLSMHPVLIDDSGFDYDDNKLLAPSKNDSSDRKVKHPNSTEEPEKKLMKFTPDMFFADLPSGDCTTDVEQSNLK